jgi:hypothetical protein
LQKLAPLRLKHSPPAPAQHFDQTHEGPDSERKYKQKTESAAHRTPRRYDRDLCRVLTTHNTLRFCRFRSGHVGNSVYDLNQPKGQKKCANARPGRCDRGFLIAATLFALQGQARIVKKVSDCDNNIIYRFEEACELKWEPYRPTSSLRSREDSLSLALPDGLLPPLRHSVTPAQHS